MVKKLRLLLVFFLCVVPFSFSRAQENSDKEAIQITTYYPSPYGSYQLLSSKVVQLDPADGPPDYISGREEKGMLYFDDDEGLQYYDGGQWRQGLILRSDGAPYACVSRKEGALYYDTGSHSLEVCTYSAAGGYAWAGASGGTTPSGTVFQVAGDKPVCPEGSHVYQRYWVAKQCCGINGRGGVGNCCSTGNTWVNGTSPATCTYSTVSCALTYYRTCTATDWTIVSCVAD